MKITTRWWFFRSRSDRNELYRCSQCHDVSREPVSYRYCLVACWKTWVFEIYEIMIFVLKIRVSNNQTFLFHFSRSKITGHSNSNVNLPSKSNVNFTFEIHIRIRRRFFMSKYRVLHAAPLGADEKKIALNGSKIVSLCFYQISSEIFYMRIQISWKLLNYHYERDVTWEIQHTFEFECKFTLKFECKLHYHFADSGSKIRV